MFVLLYEMLFSRLADYSSPIKTLHLGDFPGGPVFKNLPCDAGDAGSIPSGGVKIPHAAEHISPHITTRKACVTQPRPDEAK